MRLSYMQLAVKLPG